MAENRAQGQWFPRIFSLEGKVAIVTGGGGGLGRAMALGLADAGASVVVADARAEMAERVAAEIAARGRASLALTTDVTNAAQVNAMVAQTVARFGTVDILVNSHGTARRLPAIEYPESEWDRVVDINLKGTFLCCQAAGRVMIERRQGKIVNIASIGGFVAYPKAVAYLASKGGVVQLTRSLALEWAPYNVQVNGIAPCLMNTELVARANAADPSTSEFILARTPMGRMGEPEELVGAVIFLSSAASSLVTGHTLAVDGGYLAE